MHASRDGRDDRPMLNRRDFLGAGFAGTLGLAISGIGARGTASAVDNCAVILIMLVGGPSQFETFDPKPDAAAEIRGPFRPIATSVPGIFISEHLPRLARHMRDLTIIRSLYHDAAPVHETGLQLIQTGHLCSPPDERPHIGALAAHSLGPRNDLHPFVLLPGPIDHLGLALSRGQSAGKLGREFGPFCPPASTETVELPALSGLGAALDITGESGRIREAYGPTRFAQNLLRARRLVTAGVRLVTVNMFETVFRRATWDCHGSRPFSTFDDYKREVLPTFDTSLSTLIDDLDSQGMMGSTLVVATGEFGRTPRLNAAGGRDHWPGVWRRDARRGRGRGANHRGQRSDRLRTGRSPDRCVGIGYVHLSLARHRSQSSNPLVRRRRHP